MVDCVLDKEKAKFLENYYLYSCWFHVFFKLIKKCFDLMKTNDKELY